MTEGLNRKALNHLVWSKPMIQVAKKYGLSRAKAADCRPHGPVSLIMWRKCM